MDLKSFFKALSVTKAKEWIFSIPSIGSLLLLTSFVPFPGQGQENGDLELNTVVIDPGHGGKDPGAIGHSKVKEKDIVLDVSLKLGAWIKDHFENVKVIYTRKDDEFIELHERGRIANENDADLFISVHANVAGSPHAHGCETYVLGLHRSKANLEVAKKENSAILMEKDHERHYGGFDPHSPESYIALELMQSEYLEQSLHFAAKAQAQFADSIGRKDRGVKQAGFLVLYHTTMPSVLVELGFISNPEEERFLNSEKGKKKMAMGLYNAFKEYKKLIDERNSFEGTKDSILASQPEAEELEPGDKEERNGDHEKDGENGKLPDKKVRFKVQIAASHHSLDLTPENFKGLSDVDEYISSDGTHKYTVGSTASYEEAERIREEMKKTGYKGAFIVAFREGERIGLEEAMNVAGRNGDR